MELGVAEYLMQFVQRLWVARIGEVIYERQTESTQRMGIDADEHEEILREIETGNGPLASGDRDVYTVFYAETSSIYAGSGVTVSSTGQCSR